MGDSSLGDSLLRKHGLPALGSVFLVFMPGGVVLASLIAICVHTGTLWPWGMVVHEDGRRTLAETVFYFEHAARELLIDLLLGVAVAGSVLRFYPAVSPSSTGRRRARRMLFSFLVLSAAVIGVILVGAGMQAGSQEVTANLMQMYTREGAVPAPGAHWRYHLLSRLGVMLSCYTLTGFSRRLADQDLPAGPRGSRKVFLIAVAVLLAPGLFVGFTTEPFASSVYLGHQAREIVTHTLVTAPWALGLCLWLRRRVMAETGKSGSRGVSGELWIVAGSAVLIYCYLIVGAVITGARAEAQTDSLVRLVAVHFLEHSFSYLVTPLVAGSICLWSVRASLKRKQGTA